MKQVTDPLVSFLKPFTEGAKGYIGMTKVQRSQDAEQNTRWGQFSNLFPVVKNGTADLDEDVFEDGSEWEWYFTPAVLSEPTRTQAKFKQSNVIWIDFDEPVDWENMSPAPSIVVQTSPEKFHCYWMMESPITDVNDMRYWCKRFLTHFGGDLSGFDATQLLKLPFGKNLKLGAMKDGTPFEPKVVKFDTALTYNEGSFSSMPEPAMNSVTLVDLSDLPDIPSLEGDWEEYFDQYEDSLPQDMYKRLRRVQDNGAEKRSGGLYNLVCDLLKYLEDPEKVFQVLYGSPNDKFTADHGSSQGARLLWKDINRIDAKKKQEKAESSTREAIQGLMMERKSLREKGVEIERLILEELSQRGRFVQTTENDSFYYELTDEVPTVYDVSTEKSTKLTGYLAKRYGLSAGVDSTIISGVLHAILYRCLEQDPIHMHTFAYYNVYTNTVYVDKYDGTMYVMNGDSVERHPHGYEEVYFKRTEDEFPQTYEYSPNYRKGGLEALVLNGPNYNTFDQGIERKHILHMLKTWVSCFFFPAKMDTKPIVLIYGEPDSGKTTMFLCVSKLLTGNPSEAVAAMPEEKRDFDVLVSQHPYLFLDNVNTYSKEIQERLAQAATGYVSKARTLHTNKGVTRLRAQSYLGMTSFTVDKLQSDVAQRTLIMPVNPIQEQEGSTRRAVSAIMAEIEESRDALWSELLDYVNRIIRNIAMHGLSTENVKLRMADFAAFLQLTADMDGLSYPTMEKFILRKQSEIFQANDPMYSALRAYLESGSDLEREFSVRSLYQILCRVDRKFAARYNASTKFASALKAASARGDFEFAGIGMDVIGSSTSAKYRPFAMESSLVFEDEEDEDW